MFQHIDKYEPAVELLKRPRVLFLATRPQASADKSDITRTNLALIVLLPSIPVCLAEQCTVTNVYFVHHSSLFIQS